MTERLKQLSLLDEAGRFRFMHLVLLVALLVYCLRPGWVSVAALLVVVAATAFRWTLEPRPVTPAKPEDIERVHGVVEKLILEVKGLRARFAKFEFLEKAVPRGAVPLNKETA